MPYRIYRLFKECSLYPIPALIVYRMTGATPKISLPFARLGDKSKKWSLYGFWPTEGDRLDQIKIMGSPRPGDQVVFENMGAYIHGMESQFCVDETHEHQL